MGAHNQNIFFSCIGAFFRSREFRIYYFLLFLLEVLLGQIIVILCISADLSFEQLVVILFFKARSTVDFRYFGKSLTLNFLHPIAPVLGRICR